MYNVVQIWPGLIVCKQVTVCPGHIWTTLYNNKLKFAFWTSYPSAKPLFRVKCVLTIVSFICPPLQRQLAWAFVQRNNFKTYFRTLHNMTIWSGVIETTYGFWLAELYHWVDIFYPFYETSQRMWQPNFLAIIQGLLVCTNYVKR
jgi:hypothetical protein